MSYSVEELLSIKQLIDEGKASPQLLTEYGYITQLSKKVDKNKFKQEETK